MNTYEPDVEWFDNDKARYRNFPSRVWTDEKFRKFIADEGIVEALEQVSIFCAKLSVSLYQSGITTRKESDWANRTIGLLIRMKTRRQFLRRAVRETIPNGEEIVRNLIARIREDYED